MLNWGFLQGWEAVLQGRALIPSQDSRNEPHLRVDESGVFVKHVILEGCLQDKTGGSVATEVGLLLPDINGEDRIGTEWTPGQCDRLQKFSFRPKAGRPQLPRAY